VGGRAEDEIALCNLTSSEAEGGGVTFPGYSGGTYTHSSTAVVPRSHLRPPIKAAIFLSILGTQPNT